MRSVRGPADSPVAEIFISDAPDSSATGIPSDVEEGVLVLQVSVAVQQAGIESGTLSVSAGGQPTMSLGDIVVALDGRPVGTPGQIIAYIDNNRRPGDTVTVTVVRQGQRTDVPVPLGERPQQR